MEFSIGEFSQRTGLGIHTLRYYEHEDLLEPSRNSANRRRYNEKDIAWIEFIKRLKETDMPIKEIARYAKLRAKGNSTLEKRLNLLLAHRKKLSQQINNLLEHQKKLDEKIKFYKNEIKKNNSPNR